MKRRIALGFTLALFLLVVLVGLVGSQDVFTALARADRAVLATGFLSGFLALTFRGLVWSRFLMVVDETWTHRAVANVFLTAMFVKYVTPYGQVATEPFVAYLVSQRSDMEIEGGLAGIVSADLLNYVPYYTFGFLGLGIVVTRDAVGDGLRSQFAAFGALFLFVATLVFVALRRPALVYRFVLTVAAGVRRVLTSVTNRFDQHLAPTAVRSRLDGFYATIRVISSDRQTLAVAFVYAHLGMAFLMAPVYIGAVALGYELSLAVVAVVVALGKLGSIVPAPGGTGGVEAVVTAGLTALGGLDPASALTVALIYRACTYWLTIVVGGLVSSGAFVRISEW